MTRDIARAMKDLAGLDGFFEDAMGQLDRRDPALCRVWNVLDRGRTRVQNLAMFLTLAS